MKYCDQNKKRVHRVENTQSHTKPLFFRTYNLPELTETDVAATSTHIFNFYVVCVYTIICAVYNVDWPSRTACAVKTEE